MDEDLAVGGGEVLLEYADKRFSQFTGSTFGGGTRFGFCRQRHQGLLGGRSHPFPGLPPGIIKQMQMMIAQDQGGASPHVTVDPVPRGDDLPIRPGIAQQMTKVFPAAGP